MLKGVRGEKKVTGSSTGAVKISQRTKVTTPTGTMGLRGSNRGSGALCGSKGGKGTRGNLLNNKLVIKIKSAGCDRTDGNGQVRKGGGEVTGRRIGSCKRGAWSI